MFDLIAIVAAIVFVLLVLQLRAMLAMQFLKQTVRRVPGDWAHLVAAEDVITHATHELAPLGFDGPQWLSVTPQPVELANVRAIATMTAPWCFSCPRSSRKRRTAASPTSRRACRMDARW